MAFISESNFLGALNINNANSGVTIDEMPSTVLWPSPAPNHPTPTNQIVQQDQTCHVHFQWEASGLIHSMFAAPPGPGHSADWICTVYCERIGGGAGPTFTSPLVPFTGGFSNTYTHTVNIPGGSLAVGVHRITCTITCRHHSGIPLPTAAFDEGMLIQIYSA